MNIHELFNETTQRNPQDRELFVHDGHIHVYHRETNQWEDLGEENEKEAVPEVGSLQFEMQRGIVAEGSPAFIIQLLLRAFYRFIEPEAKEFTNTIFNIFRECQWTGPIESENREIRGTLKIDEDVQLVDDLRIVMAQLQDPQFNGWIQTERGRTTRFTNIGQSHRIDIDREEKNEGNQQHSPSPTKENQPDSEQK